MENIIRPQRKWTVEERDVIIECVEKYPVNLSYAFEMASLRIDRSVRLISAYYYYSIRKKENIITTGSNKGFSKNNIKNQHKCKETGELKPDLQPIQYIIKEILNLSMKERAFLATFLTNPDKLIA